MKDTIYITGHRHPDTDSIASSIAYAYLKNEEGKKAIPCRLGSLNDETKYLLDRFNFREPHLLKDARSKLKDVDLESPVAVNKTDTLFEALAKMKETEHKYMAVMNQDKVVGMITRNDIGVIGLGDTAVGIDLLKQTSIENICKVLDGKIIYKDEQMALNGKVSIIALCESKAENYEVKNRIVIIGNDTSSQIECIKKGAGLLIVVWTDSIDSSVIECAREYHCSILISGHGSMNTARYIYFAPEVSLLMKTEVMSFYNYEYVEDVIKKMRKNRYRAYPVLNKENKLMGYILKYHAINFQNKQIIMVDHNEFSQSVPSIEKAEILEVVDHHRIYDFYSIKPISFRNEIVGSTATIISSMFFDRDIEIPSNLAGLLLAAILSDTLNFQSPTCTNKDLDIASRLEKICGLKSEDLAHDMFFSSSHVNEMTVSDFLNGDVKLFDIDQYKVMIAQVIVPSMDALEQIRDTIQEELDENQHKNSYDLGVLVFTGILDYGSTFYVSGKLSNWFKESLAEEDEYPIFMQGILSRKNQILPMITEIIDKNS